MTIPKVFIGSSSEGLVVVDTVKKLLQRELRGTADVSAWPSQFKLTKAYIESLEKLLETSDFAGLVLTPDDVTTSREAEKLAPRDNVIFELGLFFGRLGRERCFFIQPQDLRLKLPSDLLGIEPAKFFLSPNQDPVKALNSACAQISKSIREAIATLPSRPRLSDEGRATQAAMRRFCDRIEGAWWERISLKGELQALSFFRIRRHGATTVAYEGGNHG